MSESSNDEIDVIDIAEILDEEVVELSGEDRDESAR